MDCWYAWHLSRIFLRHHSSVNAFLGWRESYCGDEIVMQACVPCLQATSDALRLFFESEKIEMACIVHSQLGITF